MLELFDIWKCIKTINHINWTKNKSYMVILMGDKKALIKFNKHNKNLQLNKNHRVFLWHHKECPENNNQY